jgi:wobble nucleotide-excising tRNase
LNCQTDNLEALSSDCARLKAIKARFDPNIAPLCEEYITEREAKLVTEAARDAARLALNQHREAVFPIYGDAINEYLQRFNAGFRIGPVEPINQRGGSTATYTLLIDAQPVGLSADGPEPSFRGTLSAGDRNTLALAFFFASLDQDPNLADTVVVVDDPMTSLDDHRSLHTIQEINRLLQVTSQMIVLSHSKPFLFAVWDKCRQITKSAVEVRRDQAASTLANWNVTDDMITEHDRRYLRAAEYVRQSDPQIERQTAESLRLMLEAFLRVAYPTDFEPGNMIGGFHRKCNDRLGQQNEILNANDTQELRSILDYANKFHHDTNATFETEIINDAELHDFTVRTMNFMGRT